MTLFKDANPQEKFSIMLEERICSLEDQLLSLQHSIDVQQRNWTKSSFKILRSNRSWLIRMYLYGTAWPKEIKQQSKLCSDFFKQLNYFCEPRQTDDENDCQLVLCSYIQSPCSYWTLPINNDYCVIEAILTSNVSTITSEGIGAAFDRAWINLIIPEEQNSINTIERIDNSIASIIEYAIHCINGQVVEYCKNEEYVDSIDSDDVRYAAIRMQKEKINELNIKLHNPKIHELFPGIFSNPP